ncbi:MAG: hypothetical protein HYX20_03605 [Candidatus Yanofskybacteria bacterium]|nr:hypothetical protein [Candidatus Yanofskybacteria bacterium]
MNQENFNEKKVSKSSFEIGQEVSILLGRGIKDSGWKITKIFGENTPFAGKVLVKKEERDIWAGKERGMKERKRIVEMESLEKLSDKSGDQTLEK